MKPRFYLLSLVTIAVALLATIGIHHPKLTGASEGSTTQLLSTRERFLECDKSEVFRTSDMACYTPQGE
ncbi:MAG: hypothetical protein LH702_21270 [Phormidesmis sp. CAN_BIN44]|nr:hypothetical protein [Phormidesmis sp. CAN_BIN44]